MLDPCYRHQHLFSMLGVKQIYGVAVLSHDGVAEPAEPFSSHL